MMSQVPGNYYTNVTEKNKGIEFSLGYDILELVHYKMDFTGNWTLN